MFEVVSRDCPDLGGHKEQMDLKINSNERSIVKNLFIPKEFTHCLLFVDGIIFLLLVRDLYLIGPLPLTTFDDLF